MARIAIIVGVLATAAAAAAPSARRSPPAIEWATGYANGPCEAHPHAGVQTSDGGWLMVGDSVCYAGSPAFNRAIFVVKSDATGKKQWTRQLGDLGWNYGKFAVELDDGTFLVAGAMSVHDAPAKAKGFPYIESRALVRLARNGTTLSTAVFPNARKLEGRRDGFMCATPVAGPAAAADPDALEVVATGWVGGDAGFDPATGTYDDQPMFLIQGGTAFLMRLSYSRARPARPPRVLSEQPVVDPSPAGTRVFYQGMRVYSDPANGAVAVSAASQPSPSDYNTQWGLAVFDAPPPSPPPPPAEERRAAANASSLPARFAKLYPASNARHPGPAQGGVMSHPYAFTLAPGGAGYVLAGLAVLQPPNGAPARCEGRLALVAPNGTLVWDTRFRADTDAAAPDENTECYGVANMPGGGYAVACGAGVEGELHPRDSPRQKTWRAFVMRADGEGAPLWQKCYTNNTGSQVGVDNAGEYIVGARDGGLAVYIDAQALGPPGTGGNFGLMKLAAGG